MVYHVNLLLWFATVQTIEPRINACFDPLARGLFLTCTERNILLFYTIQVHDILQYHMGNCSLYVWKEKILTWNGSSLYEVANPHFY